MTVVVTTPLSPWRGLLKKSCFYQKWPLRFQFLTMLQDRGTNNRDMKNWINLLLQQPPGEGLGVRLGCCNMLLNHKSAVFLRNIELA